MSEQPETNPPAKARKRRGLGIVIVLVLVIIAAGAAALYAGYGGGIGTRMLAALKGYETNDTTVAAVPAPQTAPSAEPAAATAVPEDVAQLRDALIQLRQRLDAVEMRLGAIESTQAAPARDYSGEIATLQARVSALESQTAQAADKNVLDALQMRVAALERENAGTERQRAAQILALSILARSAETAQPLKPELDAFAALSPGDPAIAVLMPYAEKAVPTRSELAARFPDAARAALANTRLQSAQGYFAKLWARALNLVSVRRTGPETGDTVEDRLARAGHDLQTGDLAGAVMEVRALTGPAADTMAPWLKDAEARLAVDTSIAGLDSRIVHALAVPGADTSGTNAAGSAP